MARVSRPRQVVRVRRAALILNDGRQNEAMLQEQIPEQLAPGDVHGNWRSSVGSIPGPAPFSWVENPREITRPLRYKVRSLFRGAGNSASMTNAKPRPVRVRQARMTAIVRLAGNAPAKPSIRNRLTSFGSRVPPVNPPSPNAQ